MWCYQKPGFEALLLAELQRQQQCSQFCDTVLQTEGVSVPAHGCILSAISPHISSTLSSMAPPPAGQSRLLDFRALGACTLLHLVRLLYSGEMAGEGEKEKQKAISAAATLGIHGLVEVTKRDRKSRIEKGEGRHTDVGVQTEPLVPEKNEGRRGRWRRGARDGSTFLWNETVSDGEKDTWTQTEAIQVNAAPPAASFETIDMAALQSLGQTDPHILPPQISYVPISLVYPPDENQTHQLTSAPVWHESTAAGDTSVAVVAPSCTPVPPSLLPFSSQETQCAADPQSWWAGPPGAARDASAAEELEKEQFEQFQGNIPGYISYFLNPDKEEGSRRGRARRRRGAGVGGARGARTGERRARRPRATTGGRGRRGLMHTVDVQEVGVSRLQMLFLQRWGGGASRPGQGGGAVGRKLYVKTRELLKPAKSQRRRGRGKVWEFSQSGDLLPYSEGGGGGNTQRGRRNTAQQFNQDGLPVGRARRAKAKPTSSVSIAPPPMRYYNVHNLCASSPSLQPSPSAGLLSPAASYVSPAPSLLQTTSLPPPAPPSNEEQPEHIDRLLEEVMMGLDILPNKNNSGGPHCQPPLSTSSSCCTYTSSGNTLAQNKRPGCTAGTLDAGPGFHGSTQVVDAPRRVGGSSSANSELPLLQQQGGRELNEMLEHFLQSFEHHVDSCSAREEVDTSGQSCTEASQPYTVLRKYRKTNTKTTSSQITELQQNNEAGTPLRRSQPRQASARSAVAPKHTEGRPGEVRAPRKPHTRRRKNQYLFTLEEKRVRKPVSSSAAKTKFVHVREDKQLQQMPVVKLERNGLLPVRLTRQGHSCQSLEVKSPAKTKTTSVKYPHGSLSDKNMSAKTYPIRSRFREAHIMDSMPFLGEPLPDKQTPSAGQPARRRGRTKKNGQPLSLSNGESSTPPIQPQPVDKQLEKDQETHEEELTVQPQEKAEGPPRMGKKRGAEREEEISGDATTVKRVCFEQMAQPTSGTRIPSSEAAGFVFETTTTESEAEIDVETVSLTSVGECLQREEQKPAWSEIKLRETEESLMDEEKKSSGNEIMDVDGDVEDDCHKDAEKDHRQSGTTLAHFVKLNSLVSPPAPSAEEVGLGSTGSWEGDKDEDIDVIGDSSPISDPVIISWTESSEGEEEEGDEDVDVVGEEMDCASSADFTTVSKGELVNRKYLSEML